MKKTLFILLAGMLLLTACSESSNTDNSETKTDAGNTGTVEEVEISDIEEDIVKDDVPELTFEKEFNILEPEASHCTDHMFGTEITGEAINDAQYNMLLAMEQRFGIKINEVRGNSWNLSGQAKELVMSGDTTYDIAFQGDHVATEVLPYTYTLDNLSYFNFDKPYWDKGMIDAGRIYGKAYYAYGAFHLSHYDMTACLIFSKGLVADLNLDSPYEIVKNGDWTIDKLFEMGQKATFDVDGDGSMGDGDSYGYVSTPKEVLPSFWISSGEKTIIPGDDAIFGLNQSENFFDTINKVFEVMWDGGIWYYNRDPGEICENLLTMFENKHVLFSHEMFGRLAALRDMNEDFGIIPYPKYTAEQSQYYSRVEGGSFAMFGLMNMADPDETGALMEAMACYGFNNVVPEYYEITLKRKNARDEESMEMLDVIFRSRTIDLGDTWWTGTIRDGFFGDSVFRENNRNFASSYAKVVKQVQAQMKIFDKTVSSKEN